MTAQQRILSWGNQNIYFEVIDANPPRARLFHRNNSEDMARYTKFPDMSGRDLQCLHEALTFALPWFNLTVSPTASDFIADETK